MKKFREVKELLADTVVRVSTYAENDMSWEIDLNKMSPEEKITLAIFGFEDFDDLDVEKIYVDESGFLVDFVYSEATVEAFDKFARKHSLEILATGNSDISLLVNKKVC